MAGAKCTDTAMLVIDIQNDFILPGCLAIISNVIHAVSVARDRGIFVIWVVREHDPWGRDVEIFCKHLYVKGAEQPTSW